MPLPTIPSGNVASATAGAFEVANSCRFNDDDSSYMHKTPGSGGNQKTWTFSAWVKRGTLGTRQGVINVNGASNPYFFVEFIAADNLQIQDYDGSQDTELTTTAKYRDVGAWYHICVAYDTTQATNTNRIKLYVNGTQVTAFDTSTYCAENFDSQMNSTNQLFIGQAGTQKFDGYMAEVCGVDGSQLAPTSFGEFDSDSPTIFKPIEVSGLTFGTNGFYLDFEDSSNLGNDANGGTDLTEVNLAAADQATDTPTNNFSTGNPLVMNPSYVGTFSEGNNKLVTSAGGKELLVSTLGFTAGKWYAEFKADDIGGGTMIGIIPYDVVVNTLRQNNYLGQDNGSVSMLNTTGAVYNPPTASGISGVTYTDGDIIGVAVDMTNSFCYFHKNGTYINSGDPTSGGTGTGGVPFVKGDDIWCFAGGDSTDAGGSVATLSANFGGCPAFTISSGNADGNGHGNMEYAIPSNYYTLCTKNLAEFG